MSGCEEERGKVAQADPSENIGADRVAKLNIACHRGNCVVRFAIGILWRKTLVSKRLRCVKILLKLFLRALSFAENKTTKYSVAYNKTLP
jgi:hypothetical protein